MMQSIKVRAHVGVDGVLKLEIPLGLAETDLRARGRLTLVTHPSREFSRVLNLELEDWEDAP